VVRCGADLADQGPQALDHPGEGLGEAADLVLGVDVDVDRQVALRDLARLLRQLFHRTADQAGHDDTEDDRQDHPDDGQGDAQEDREVPFLCACLVFPGGRYGFEVADPDDPVRDRPGRLHVRRAGQDGDPFFYVVVAGGGEDPVLVFRVGFQVGHQFRIDLPLVGELEEARRVEGDEVVVDLLVDRLNRLGGLPCPVRVAVRQQDVTHRDPEVLEAQGDVSEGLDGHQVAFVDLLLQRESVPGGAHADPPYDAGDDRDQAEPGHEFRADTEIAEPKHFSTPWNGIWCVMTFIGEATGIFSGKRGPTSDYRTFIPTDGRPPMICTFKYMILHDIPGRVGRGAASQRTLRRADSRAGESERTSTPPR